MEAELRKKIIFDFAVWLFFIFNGFGTITSVRSISSDSSYFVFQQTGYSRDCKDVLNACSSTHNTSGVYLIQPDGYPEPFEVYCDNDLDNSGWTVLQRRLKESVNFNRKWKDFKNGFGFLRSEFWMGNDKIAFLTNQRQYQLRLEFENDVGQSYYVTYDQFRISDEWGEYSLSSLGTYGGTAESHTEWCPSNKIFSNETCEMTCDDSETCISSTSRTEPETCVCVGDYMIQGENCIPRKQCGCFAAGKGSVLRNGESYVNSDCTRRSNCSNNRLREESYHCSDDATCGDRDGVRRCYCNDEYGGDGLICTRTVFPKDCYERYVAGTNSDGVYTIFPEGWTRGIRVYCNMESNGGGWTVFQRRSSASVDFYRGWADYKNGFGNHSVDHWLGNDYIHAMTHQKTYELRIDLRNSGSSSYYALYSSFSISDEDDKYRLSIGSYSGNTGPNSLTTSSNRQFSTRDNDNDGWSRYNCAERHIGAWWFTRDFLCTDQSYRSSCPLYCSSYGNFCEAFPDGGYNCAHCAGTHLNGDYDGSTRGTNMFWEDLPGNDCSIQYTEMKIRPV